MNASRRMKAFLLPVVFEIKRHLNRVNIYTQIVKSRFKCIWMVEKFMEKFIKSTLVSLIKHRISWTLKNKQLLIMAKWWRAILLKIMSKLNFCKPPVNLRCFCWLELSQPRRGSGISKGIGQGIKRRRQGIGYRKQSHGKLGSQFHFIIVAIAWIKVADGLVFAFFNNSFL